MSHTSFSFDDDAGLDTAAENLVDKMPDPSEEAITAMGSAIPQDAPAPTVTAAPVEPPRSTVDHPMNGKRDKNGILFDAGRHTGSMLKNGSWRERKKRTSTVSAGPAPVDPSIAAAQQSELLKQQSRAAGIAAAHLTFMSCVAVGGREWQPRDIPLDERATLEQAYGDYFMAKNITDFPPGVALAIALTMYAAPRFVMPETRTRLSKVKTWFAARIANAKLKREAKKRGIGVDELRKEMGLQ